MEVLEQYHEGIIALSSCLAGEVAVNLRKNIVCLTVLRKDIVRIISYDHRNTQLFGQPHNTRIYRRLLCQSMILHLEEIIIFSKYLQMTERCLFGFLIVVLS